MTQSLRPLTNLDLHDLGAVVPDSVRRAGVLYRDPAQGPAGALANRITAHWIKGGIGGEILPERREAVKLLKVVESLSSAVQGSGSERNGQTPFLWATTPQIWRRRHTPSRGQKVARK